MPKLVEVMEDGGGLLQFNCGINARTISSPCLVEWGLVREGKSGKTLTRSATGGRIGRKGHGSPSNETIKQDVILRILLFGELHLW